MIELPDLYPEKKEICKKIIEYFKYNRMGYIKVPTGWGKTFLTKHLIKKYYCDGKSVLFLVSRNNPLLNQTFYNNQNENEPLFPNSILLSSENVQVNKVELIKEINEKEKGLVVFASLQTVLSKNNQDLKDVLCNKIDLVIIDEIHNFINNQGNELIKEIGEFTKIFGMTATPFQGVVGNIKFVDDISIDMNEIFNKSLPQCIMEKQLSELSYKIIRSNQHIFQVFDFEKGLSELGSQELFLNCSTLEKINLVIQRTYLSKKVYGDVVKEQKKKTLIFCSPIRNIVQGFGEDEKKINALHAKLCSAIFNEELKDKLNNSVFPFNNYSDSGKLKNAVYLSSDLNKEEQYEILEAFKDIEKPPYILCTVGMLIEGFDFPDLENLILLRPTLSMRLFEQQVGRVIRLPDKSNKRRGNIFEIVDEIESLYDTFGENVFGEKNLERIQMLQPENRIEQLFVEDGNIDAFETNKIEVSEINFKNTIGKFHDNSVQIPPLNLRAKYFFKLLTFIEEKVEGALKKEKVNLIGFAMKFKIKNIDDAREISRIILLLDELEQEAFEDSRLSKNCEKNKTQLFREVKWLIQLRALTDLKYFCSKLDVNEKETIIQILGFKGNYNQIDNFRKMCLENGNKRNINQLIKYINNVKGISPNFMSLVGRKYIYDFRVSVYWASCFIIDNPEIKELFESKDWNYKIKKFIVN